MTVCIDVFIDPLKKRLDYLEAMMIKHPQDRLERLLVNEEYKIKKPSRSVRRRLKEAIADQETSHELRTYNRDPAEGGSVNPGT